ncbi:hypothetical protein MMC24_006212 [Lignoscripta atroalba]|nr:hypothetical protein [Lignoscripta atroalba]
MASLCTSFFLTILALSGSVRGQATNNIDIEDVADLPTPSVLGPPVGTVSAGLPYNSESVLAAAVQAVTTAADAQNTFITVTTVAASSPTGASGAPPFAPAFPPGSAPPGVPTSPARKRDAEAATIVGRVTAFPIDTKQFPVPAGYTPAFASLQGSTQGKGYLTYKTLNTYDPSACAAECNKINACQFFNVYYEQDPDANDQPVNNIKCALYSLPQTAETATNEGQWRGTFHVIITGSNGYNKATTPVAPTGFSLDVLDAAINAPLLDSTGQSTFIQPVYLNTYDPAVCAAACDAQTVWDRSQAPDDCNYKTCVFANLYILSLNGVPQTSVCALYTQGWGSTYAVNTGYTSGSDTYVVSNSIGLTNTAAAAVYPKTCAKTAPKSLGGAVLASVPAPSNYYNNYFGFYSATAEGSPAYASTDKFGVDKLAYYETPTSVLPSRDGCTSYGYIMHVDSGLCVTLGITQSTKPTFDTSGATLQKCNTAAAAPPLSQRFCRDSYVETLYAPYKCMTFAGELTEPDYPPFYSLSYGGAPSDISPRTRTAQFSQWGGNCVFLKFS